MGLEFIFTGFENASPINWDVDPEGVVHIEFNYDHERSSPNRAVLHWHFQLQAPEGSDLTLLLKNFDNIWNGKHGSPIAERTSCAVSADGVHWKVVEGRKAPENFLEIQVHMDEDRLYVARIEPYRLRDLERFLDEIRDHSLVEVTPVGHTIEGRELEIMRVGDPDAPFRVLLRARAHPWETGGNYLLQGLIRSLLQKDAEDCTDTYCVYAMPMANKDGVARGSSRFNLMGKDLNRDWGHPADPGLAPENHALETWLEAMAARDMRPHLAIDFHNDNSGKIHVSRPEGGYEAYLAGMQRFEALMMEHTWFTEGSTGGSFRNPGTFGEGLLIRYGIDACIMELNCNWSAGLQKAPLGKDWEFLGAQMREVFFAYFMMNEPSR